MLKSYKYTIIYFIGFSFLLLISATLLFEEKIGFSVKEVLDYYAGNESRFMMQKSALGLLKIILPHIFAFGLFTMVILHFLIFTQYKNTQKIIFLIYLVFITAILEMLSPFFTINGFEFFAYIKLASFFLFEALIVYISFLLFWSIIKD